MTRSTPAFFAVLLSLPFALVGCDDGGSTTGPTGQAIYENPLPTGNSFSCETCHALSEPAADGVRRPGHSIGDAANRPTYKNGQLTELRDAVNSCVVEWMGGEPLAADSTRWINLEQFLQEQAGDAPAEALTFEIVAPPADLTGGDVAAGETLFNTSCSGCHAMDGVGSDLAPGLVATNLEADFIARRIRLSGDPDSSVYDGLTEGRMPFWAADRLSDGETRDLIAYVMEISTQVLPADGGMPMPDAGSDAGPPGRTCGSTHSTVGHVAELSTLQHGVSGTVTIVDDCTLEVTNFNYDASGIDVRFYGGIDGNYRDGFGIGPDLVRPGNPYFNETLRVQLPEGQTLDDMNGVSVWCVDVFVNFGSGQFMPPS